MEPFNDTGDQAIREGLDTIAKLGRDLIKENRSIRRWKIIRRFVFWMIVIAVFMAPYISEEKIGSMVGSAQPHVAVISMQGPVMAGAEIDADKVIDSLQKAFEASQSKGILLQINSPGGSPVQAERIYDEILRLRALHPDKPVVAVIEDIGASAAYYIASAADQIVASKASLVGSIGVIVNGFGAVDAIRKLGIERRLITAGDNKGMLDPFLPQDDTQEAYMQRIVDQVHQQFISAVKQGRGDRLKDRADIFSGLVWNGEEALELGLIDAIGSNGYALREIFKLEDEVDYTPVVDWMDAFSKGVGASMGTGLKQALIKQSVGLE